MWEHCDRSMILYPDVMAVKHVLEAPLTILMLYSKYSVLYNIDISLTHLL